MSEGRETGATANTPRATYDAGLERATSEEKKWQGRSSLASKARLLCFALLAGAA